MSSYVDKLEDEISEYRKLPPEFRSKEAVRLLIANREDSLRQCRIMKKSFDKQLEICSKQETELQKFQWMMRIIYRPVLVILAILQILQILNHFLNYYK